MVSRRARPVASVKPELTGFRQRVSNPARPPKPSSLCSTGRRGVLLRIGDRMDPMDRQKLNLVHFTTARERELLNELDQPAPDLSAGIYTKPRLSGVLGR